MSTKPNCILYLIRTSEEDLQMLNKSLMLVEANLLPSIKEPTTDIILFHESSFSESYKSRVHKPRKGNILFQEIELRVPDYPEEIKNKIPFFFPHPTHGENGIHGETYFKEHGFYNPGFSLGYRGMCSWFTWKMYEEPILENYDYYLRLDNDSYILSAINYDVFEWIKDKKGLYGTLKPAIQIDVPEVVDGLNNFVKNWLVKNNVYTKVNVGLIPNGCMFYTNFEIGCLNWFKTSWYRDFSQYIINSGMIYIKRYGDAPLKYLGVNLFMDQQHILYPTGFTYQHGAIYNV